MGWGGTKTRVGVEGWVGAEPKLGSASKGGLGGGGEPKLGSVSKGGLRGGGGTKTRAGVEGWVGGGRTKTRVNVEGWVGGGGGSGELIVAKSNTSLGEREDKEDREPKLGSAWKGGLGEGGVR